MYGYITINKPELKFREYDEYRSYYCGVCSELKDKYGFKGQITLSYDAAFLVILLTGLYEPQTNFFTQRCVAHPFVKHQVRKNEITEYIADMNILMTYYKCIDDWNDEKKFTKGAFAELLKNKVNKIEKKYPEKSKIIKRNLEGLSIAEKKEEKNIDDISEYFANIMACISAIKDDEWKEELTRLGYYLGKFIYIYDAYDDLEKDLKKNNYNVLKYHMDNEEPQKIDKLCESILNLFMSECVRSFERLPIIENSDILRNILYAGVWNKFSDIKKRNNEK